LQENAIARANKVIWMVGIERILESGYVIIENRVENVLV
jgi:hypothetical protein